MIGVPSKNPISFLLRVSTRATTAGSIGTVRRAAKIVDPPDERGATEDFVGFVTGRGPVHLQRRIVGRDLRIHVLEATVHGELIQSDAVDYRTDVASPAFSGANPRPSPPTAAGIAVGSD